MIKIRRFDTSARLSDEAELGGTDIGLLFPSLTIGFGPDESSAGPTQRWCNISATLFVGRTRSDEAT